MTRYAVSNTWTQLYTKKRLTTLYEVSYETLKRWVKSTGLPIVEPRNGEPFEEDDVLRLHFCWLALTVYRFTYQTYRRVVVQEGRSLSFEEVFRHRYGGGCLKQALKVILPELKRNHQLVVEQIINHLEEKERESSGSVKPN